MQVKPDDAPQVPSGEVVKAPVGWGADDEEADEAGTELGLALVPQLPKRVLQPVPQWSVCIIVSLVSFSKQTLEENLP
jgi:hypothetical protein